MGKRKTFTPTSASTRLIKPIAPETIKNGSATGAILLNGRNPIARSIAIQDRIVVHNGVPMLLYPRGGLNGLAG